LEQNLAIPRLEDFVFGRAPHPVACGHGVDIGAGTVIPEINFTLPAISIEQDSWPEITRQYSEMIETVCERAVALEVPALLVEFETLPPMTIRPGWAAEITSVIAGTLDRFYHRDGLRCALRLTPNDTREHERPPRLRSGPYWNSMLRLFDLAGPAGAHLIAIESTGGKEISDPAILNGDLRALVFALGVLAARDVEFLWSEIVGISEMQGVIPSGDSACGFANTAMALAEQKMIPSVFAAIVRVASVPRSLIAYEMGAVGPSKDCAYEGPYIKAITGCPISMEGRTAACAHLSSIGNIAQAVCDCWSNESVQNVRLLSAPAPVVSMEQLAYDCRLMNTATLRACATDLRDTLVESDSALDPQAYVLRPDIVLRISEEIIQDSNSYRQTCRAVRATLRELRSAESDGRLRIRQNERPWLDRLQRQADSTLVWVLCTASPTKGKWPDHCTDRLHPAGRLSVLRKHQSARRQCECC
jgi:methanol--5-hydroxybenzimidazolylcobamide Co-methyltransferase